MVRISPETREVWITKYAFTSGIFKASVRDVEGSLGRVCHEARVPNRPHTYTAYYVRKEWCHTKEEAIAQFEAMKAEKIAKLAAKTLVINDAPSPALFSLDIRRSWEMP